MRIPFLLLPLLVLACEREPTPVNLASDVSESVTRPALRDGLVEHDATIVRTRIEAAEVIWDRDPERVLALAAAGGLATLPAGSERERPAALADAQRRWAAADAVARVLVYDPQRLAEADAPTRVAVLADAAHARHLATADPARGSATWYAAALFAQLGEVEATAFFARLRAGGAALLADDEAVVEALVAGQRPLALLDSDHAYAAQARLARLVIVIPDQDEGGSGAFVLPSAVAVTTRGGASPVAVALAGYLLAPPQAFRIALARNALVVVASGAAPPGLLNVDALRMMPVDYAALAARLPSVRAALGQ